MTGIFDIGNDWWNKNKDKQNKEQDGQGSNVSGSSWMDSFAPEAEKRRRRDREAEEVWGATLKARAASENLILFMTNYEEYHEFPYRGEDSQNRTVGYGHVILGAEGTKYDNGISKEEAKELLRSDLDRVVYQYLNPYLAENSIALNEQQYDALVDFTFNTGPSWITEYHGLRNILQSGNITYEAMHSEFMTWATVNKGQSLGLYRRRIDELEIFFKRDYSRDYPDFP